MTSPPSTKRSSSPPSVVVAPAKSREAATTNGSNAGVAAGANASSRAARPPARSNFDLEPNPFEHSFSSTSVVSHSSATDTPQKDDSTADGSNGNAKPQLNISHKAGNGADKKSTDDDSKPVLPPLAAIESPAGQGFGSWGLSSSLRSGPLSPAMLAGPANQATPSLSLAFDSSFVRTGLTPDVGRTGFTPLIAGGFPPPSPNTNALYQLVNGTTSGAPLSSSVAITPGTLSLLNGVLNSALNTIQQPTAISLDTQNQQLIDGMQAQQQQAQQQYHQPDAYSNNENANHALSNAASALFLLSQQQNLQRQQNQAQNQGQVNPSAVSAPPPMPAAAPDSPTTNAASRRATKRKSVDTPIPAPRGKKAKSITATTSTISTRGSNRRKNSKMDEDEDDDDDDEDDEFDEYTDGPVPLPNLAGANRSTGGNRGGQKKPETEEEKRRNFLERNRQAALKCRQRKKAWLQALQQKVEFLTSENERLAAALVTSREEIARLSQAVVAQGGAPSALLNQDPLANVRQNSSPVMNGSSMDMGAGARGSISSSSSNANVGSQPVHISVPMPGLSNTVSPNAPMGNAMGHARTHSHGHAHVPPPQNSVTVGGRGYGY